MLLTLKYTPNTQHKCCAALIKGSSPAIWLQQISQWGIAVSEADYFVVPQSINTTVASVLFVVFKNAEQVKNIEITHPYGKIGEGLFLPTNAMLYPAVNEGDLKRALLWTYQLYHPTIGLVGFEESDKANPASWLNYGSATNKNWSFAHQGLPPQPALRLIQVQPPTAKEVLEAVGKEISLKPLSDLAKKNKRTLIGKLLDLVLESILKLLVLIVALIAALLSKLFSFLSNSGGSYSSNSSNRKPLPVSFSSYNPSSSGGGKSDFIAKLFKRIEEKIADLEERRKGELNKLMKMFDENSDEALQYALPLDSPYLNRGQQPEGTGGWQLFKKSLNFNLGGLGGGGVGNTWTIENDQYQSLRSKYLAAAQREIERKEYKKAAYIYAHLLSDYSAAANVLEQGKYYREAAALYKEHLKNNEAAAQCLERGGLTLDAIELYKEMERDEKIGDLYKDIEQIENAEKYYELHIEKKLKSTDYIDAARVAENKLENPLQAKKILLDGWHSNINDENCLKNYFDIEAKEDSADEAVKNIYTKHTPDNKKKSFLNVLVSVNKMHTNAALLNTSRDIAFEIVSEETARNNPNAVSQLNSFFPDDRLLPSDGSRFLTQQSQQLVKKTNPNEIELATDTNWQLIVPHGQQFIALGYKDKVLRMARGNWYGNVEYYFWDTQNNTPSELTVISNSFYSNTIIINAGDTKISKKELFKNKYFNEVVTIDCPLWMPKTEGVYLITDKNGICRISEEREEVTLYFYSITGELINSIHCTYASQMLPIRNLYGKFSNSLRYNNGFFYGATSGVLFSISEKGNITTFFIDEAIYQMTSFIREDNLILIISTSEGCLAGEATNGEIKLFDDTQFFATNLVPKEILILTSNIIVLAEKSTLYLYKYNEGYPQLVQEIETKSNITSIIKGAKHNQMAVLGEDKKMSLITIEADFT